MYSNRQVIDRTYRIIKWPFSIQNKKIQYAIYGKLTSTFKVFHYVKVNVRKNSFSDNNDIKLFKT